MTVNEISKIYHEYNEFLIEKYSKIVTCQSELLYLLEQDLFRNSLLKMLVQLEMMKTNITYTLSDTSQYTLLEELNNMDLSIIINL